MVAGLVAGFALPSLDAALNVDLPVFAFTTEDAARSLLQTVATATVSVAGLSFSVTVVAFTLASSQLSPRVLRTFRADRLTQATLALLLATFVYCLAVLVRLGSVADGEPVPNLCSGDRPRRRLVPGRRRAREPPGRRPRRDRAQPAPLCRLDEAGTVRFVACAPDLDDLVRLGFEQVRIFAAPYPVVSRRLLVLLERVEDAARRHGVPCLEPARQAALIAEGPQGEVSTRADVDGVRTQHAGTWGSRGG
jgi:uncharacterized membrane protein